MRWSPILLLLAMACQASTEPTPPPPPDGAGPLTYLRLAGPPHQVWHVGEHYQLSAIWTGTDASGRPVPLSPLGWSLDPVGPVTVSDVVPLSQPYTGYIYAWVGAQLRGGDFVIVE